MINQLTTPQANFLQKLIVLTEETKIKLHVNNDFRGYIYLISRRILEDGFYDASDNDDMEKLQAMREWYIEKYK